MARVVAEKIPKPNVTGGKVAYFKVGDVYKDGKILYKVTHVDENGTLLLDKCKWYQCLWHRIKRLVRV